LSATYVYIVIVTQIQHKKRQKTERANVNRYVTNTYKNRHFEAIRVQISFHLKI